MDSVSKSAAEVAPRVPAVATPTPSLSRARRSVFSSQSSHYAPSDAGTEYTTDVDASTKDVDREDRDIAFIEKVHVQSFALWCSQNIPDPVFSERLNTAAEERSVLEELSKSVVEFVRSRTNIHLSALTSALQSVHAATSAVRYSPWPTP